jgi:glucuronokinase
LAGRIIERHAFARAGLLGNPSDGYFGRTLSVVLKNFRATVTLEESSEFYIEPDPLDVDVFHSMQDFVDAVSHQGYYGGARLVKAAVKTFSDHCNKHGIAVPARNFTARYQSSIPRQVGLAGSSAIVTAALRALMDFYEVHIPIEQQPTLVLSAEVDELGITAGLQDRVAQVYQGLVYMDFSQNLMDGLGHGAYESLDPALLPPMFVAHQASPTKVSGKVLNDLRSRWEQGDPDVLVTLERIAALATQGRDALLQGDRAAFSSLMNENFNLRRTIMQISEHDAAMVDAARDLGASAKLTGSGGAIVGVVESDDVRQQIAEELAALGARVIEPQIA